LVGGTPGSPLPPPGPSGCIISLAFAVTKFSLVFFKKPSWVPGGTCCGRGNPEFFHEFFIEKFVTVNGYGHLSEGPGGVRGIEVSQHVPPGTQEFSIKKS